MRRSFGSGMVLAAAVMLMATFAPLDAWQTQRGNAAVRAAIEAANKKFIDAALKNDAAAIAALYSEDGIAYPANSEAVKGRAALQAMWKSVLDSGISGVELNTAEVESAGDLAYETGTYVMKMKDGAVGDRGKYVVIWKQLDNQWMLHRDIWTTSMPAEKK